MVKAAAQAGGPPIDIEVQYAEPAIMDRWWVGTRCPHGNDYWLRPTPAQLEQWKRDGTP
jgi:hypothetical protein